MIKYKVNIGSEAGMPLDRRLVNVNCDKFSLLLSAPEWNRYGRPSYAETLVKSWAIVAALGDRHSFEPPSLEFHHRHKFYPRLNNHEFYRSMSCFSRRKILKRIEASTKIGKHDLKIAIRSGNMDKFPPDVTDAWMFFLLHDHYYKHLNSHTIYRVDNKEEFTIRYRKNGIIEPYVNGYRKDI